MKLGIKVGLKGDSYSDLVQAQPDFCEVWFNTNILNSYHQLFSQIKSLNIDCGLHFWGATRGNYLANLAYPDNKILQESIDLVKQTIDTANKHNFNYVNIHPGQAMLAKVDFETVPIKFTACTKAVDWETSLKTLKNSLITLAEYAKTQNVQLFIESVPKNCYSPGLNGQLDRLNYLYMAEIPISIIEQILTIENLYFTNDFGHTTANLVSTDRQTLIDFLLQKTKQLINKTKLLHVSYLIKPYNGTDYHGSLTSPEIQTDDAVPNYQELISLLKLYKNQDILALVEPETDHVGNFQVLKNLYRESLK